MINLFDNQGRLTDNALVALAEYKLSADDEQKVRQALEKDSERKKHFQWMETKIKEMITRPPEDETDDGEDNDWGKTLENVFHAIAKTDEAVLSHRTEKIIRPDFIPTVSNAANGDDTKVIEDYSSEYALAADSSSPPENCKVEFPLTIEDTSHTGSLEFEGETDSDHVLCTLILHNAGLTEQTILLSVSALRVSFNLSGDNTLLAGSTTLPGKEAQALYSELKKGKPATAKLLP